MSAPEPAMAAAGAVSSDPVAADPPSPPPSAPAVEEETAPSAAAVPPPPAMDFERRPLPADERDEVAVETAASSFAYAPPFRPRRNPARLWTIAAFAFAIAVAGLGGALYYFGAPGWAVNMGLLPEAGEPDLLLDMPRKPERRQLPSGDEYFAFSGRVVNASDRTQAVPPIVVEMRDEQNRLVFGWTIRPPVKELGPGDQASFHESRLDIPRNARSLTLSFADSGA